MTTETKEERFMRLAEKRIPKAMDAIRLVGQLSSANYEYTPEMAQEISDALQGALQAVYDGFGTNRVKQSAADERFIPGGEGFAFVNTAMEALDAQDYETAMNCMKEIMTG